MSFASLSALAILLAGSPHPGPPDEADPQQAETVTLTTAQMFDLALRAEAAGDSELAESVLKAMGRDEAIEVRNEARFRRAKLIARQGRHEEAAILLRQILDEQPTSQPVRLELARMLDLMGDEAAARRVLRELQAGTLPPEVALLVDRYSAALRARKPFGASLEMALAPDSNINRATRSQSLGTVLGDFVLDEDARERSGIGLALRGQAYARFGIAPKTTLLSRISASSNQYRDGDFSDTAISVTAGPEINLGPDRLTIEAGGLWRWFGGEIYTSAATIGIGYLSPVARRAQLRAGANISIISNRLNPLQDGETYSLSATLDRALSVRGGVGMSVGLERQDARDAGYASWGGQASLFGYRDLGPITLVGSIGLARLQADKRLLLYPEKRSDWQKRASLGGTFRNLRIGSFSPFVQVSHERNSSSIEIYEYRKTRLELGLTRSF